MKQKKQEQSLSQEVTEYNIDEIMDDYGNIMIRYRIYAIKEISKYLCKHLEKKQYGIQAYIELAEKIVNRDQEEILKKELPKTKAIGASILKNQLDALYNQHFARKTFESKYKAAITANEEVQQTHNALLQEYQIGRAHV